MQNHVLDAKTGLPIGCEVRSGAALLPGSDVLMGQHVQLEPLDIGRHAAELHRVSHGPGEDALWLYMPNGPFAGLAEHIRHLEEIAAKSDMYPYIIRSVTNGNILGQACYLRTDPANRSIEVGYILYSSQLQRTPGATEAMYLMAAHVFETLGYRRYEWKCNDLNAPSKSAALRLGFRYEGLFRQAVIVKGRNRDTAWYSILDSEWPACKQAFQLWLQAANFDEQGQQKQSLAQCRKA